MNTICAIVGFVLGVIIFLVLMRRLNFLFVTFYTIFFIFGISVVIGYIIAKLFLWIAIIAIVIGIIIWLASPAKAKENENTVNDNTVNNNGSDK